MKQFFVFFLLFFAINSNAQKLAENKVDEFTKASIKRTSWETATKMTMNLSGKTKGFQTYFRLSKINDIIYLNVKAMDGDVFSVPKGSSLMLKLDNDSIVILNNLKTEITCTGCGAIGFIGSEALGVELDYILNDEQKSALLLHKLKKVRLYLRDSYLEAEVKDKNISIAQTLIQLIDK